MAYPFLTTSMLPSYPYGDQVTWELDPIFNDSGPFIFTLQIAETPDFSILVNSTDSVNGFSITDTHRIRQNFHRSYYYRIRLQTASGAVYYSNTSTPQSYSVNPHSYWIARDIVRREYVRYRFTGIPAILLKRKNYGEVQKNAVSSIAGVAMVEDSPVYGTIYNNGYYAPFPILFSREQVDEVFQSNPEGFGVDEHENVACRTTGFPALHAKDILIWNNQRYNIEDVKSTLFPGTSIIVVQSFVSKLLPPTDPIYKIKVDESIKVVV